MELSNYLVSWVVTYLGDLQPTYIGVIIRIFTKFHGHPSSIFLHQFPSWLVVEPPRLKNMRKSNWIISPDFRGEHKKYLSCHHLASLPK